MQPPSDKKAFLLCGRFVHFRTVVQKPCFQYFHFQLFSFFFVPRALWNMNTTTPRFRCCAVLIQPMKAHKINSILAGNINTIWSPMWTSRSDYILDNKRTAWSLKMTGKGLGVKGPNWTLEYSAAVLLCVLFTLKQFFLPVVTPTLQTWYLCAQ